MTAIAPPPTDDRGRRRRGPPAGAAVGGGHASAPGSLSCSASWSLAAVASIAIGAKSMPWSHAWDAIFPFDRAIEDHLIVRELRMPRTVLALLVGAALGLAGAVMQGVTRNPLADPGLLGVNAGAALFVVIAMSQFGIADTSGLVWFALAGAAAGRLVRLRARARWAAAVPRP